MQCLCLFNNAKQNRIYAVFMRRRHTNNRKHKHLTFRIVFTMEMFLHEAIPSWAVLFFTKQYGRLPKNINSQLLGTKDCISCITSLRVILDSPRSSSGFYHLNGKFFSSVMFFAFNKDLNLSMLTDSNGSYFRVLVPTTIIPIP